NIEDADVAAITLMQTVRVLTVVFIVPFITLHGLANDVLPRYATVLAKIGIRELMTIAGFFGVILILIHLTKYVKIPGRYIIAPILGTAALVLSGINAPGLPPSIIMLAQLCVGIRMGTAINISNLTNWRKISIFTLVNVTGVIGVLIALDYFITRISSVSILTAFISTAPGGMTEMGLTAMMVHADLSIVIAFQLFRLLFVLLLVIPAINWWVNRSKKESIAE
ncbi:MAG: AbrB family transcriptional regulator, partial [Desulfitobacterium hafniense]|nr:AbrB family transcriptional regulator [Desulfitobacterium hafniense]